MVFVKIAGSSNGRTEDFESSNEGPIPSPAAQIWRKIVFVS